MSEDVGGGDGEVLVSLADGGQVADPVLPLAVLPDVLQVGGAEGGQGEVEVAAQAAVGAVVVPVQHPGHEVGGEGDDEALKDVVEVDELG